MAHIFRTVTLVIILTATSATVVDDSLASAGSLRFDLDRGSQVIESGVRAISPFVQTASGVEALTDVEQALVDWAMGRFAEAGLELPELTVRFDPSRDLCRNADGRYQYTASGESVVSICTRDSESFAAQLDRRRTLLHEFGHAWDFANVPVGDHQQLGRILGANAWNDSDDIWADRGAERFAETFVFALLDQPARRLKVSVECSDMLSAFTTATGVEPLGPGLPPCAA